ncbi:MAG: acyltransferase domain-containing protein [Fischerella sp. CENA71]|nr:acyltransferase domain-containing protein [Fischerella sp. CENA71]
MEAIAIIGIGCRFPGAENPEALWRLLREGSHSISEVPPGRWNINVDNNLDLDKLREKGIYKGAFIQQVDNFDPDFFRISPREAKTMDPQQRFLLEVSWETMENAGIAPNTLSGSNTGVFIGINSYDYSWIQLQNLSSSNVYSSTGNSHCIAANRLSYTYNFRGPSVALDAACSSSLVAVHLACQSLRLGECNAALAGGVSMMLSPEWSILLSQSGILSAEGRCKTFDANADGYVRGEGCGLVLLKRYSDALRDNDNILALIRGSAVNQDGLSNGLTAPNGPAQQEVIRQALKNAQVSPTQISYVETQGTGTSLGDSIEVNSIKAVLMLDRSPSQPCWIGSVKTNIGHLEAASGIASLIKVILAMQHGEIPPHLNFSNLNSYISIQQNEPLLIPKYLTPWQSEKNSCFASINTFGFGGTNCHLILEKAPTIDEVKVLNEYKRSFNITTLSAKSEKALKQLAQLYEVYLQANSQASLGDICFTSNTGRVHFEYRLAVVSKTNAELNKCLKDFIAGKKSSGLISGKVTKRKLPKVAFLYTGQGFQYIGMGRQLYSTQPVFRQALNYCDEILCSYTGKSFLKFIYREPGQTVSLEQTAYTQLSALFALEYALTQLWLSWGVEPTAVMGHGVGEYVAACVAGVFSLKEALKLISKYASLMQTLPANGQMVAVFADEASIQAVLTQEQKIAIAALNSPQNTVITGEQKIIEKVCATLKAAGIKTKKLKTFHAFHSPLVEPILTEFSEIAASTTYATPKIKLISNVTGKPLTTEVITSEYWCRHLSQTVRFADGMQTLYKEGYEVFVEVGPKPILLGIGRQCLPKRAGIWLASLRQGREDWQQMLESLGHLYVQGIPINWSNFSQEYHHQRISLPTYPFQRERYWLERVEKGYSKVEAISETKSQTPIIDLLNAGDIEKLAEQLEKASNFSETQKQLLPKLLKVLVKQHQKYLQNKGVLTQHYDPSSNNGVVSDIVKQLNSASLDRRLEFLIAYLQVQIAKVLELPSSSQPDPYQSLHELGLDSLMGMEIKNRIKTDLGLDIPLQRYSEGISIKQLASDLLQQFALASLVQWKSQSHELSEDLEEITI